MAVGPVDAALGAEILKPTVLSRRTEDESDDDPPADRKNSDRLLGPAVPGLTEIIPADERFADRVTYISYCLLDKNSRQDRSVSKNLGLQSRRFVKLLQNRLFNGSSPLDFIEFLSPSEKALRSEWCF